MIAIYECRVGMLVFHCKQLVPTQRVIPAEAETHDNPLILKELAVGPDRRAESTPPA